jgi:4-hydroxy-2-oxoheptanedioate aldolase
MPATVRNVAREKLEQGQLSLGVGVRMTRSVEIAKAMAVAGFDWLFLDMEHGVMSLEACAQISTAALDAGIAPIARVPNGEYAIATRALDNGALGIVMPHVDTAAEAKEVVNRLKYPPVGHRSMGGIGPHYGLRSASSSEAASALNAANLTIVMLETPTAIANAEEIAAVPGVDVLLIGTNDLCAEMGIHGDFGNERVGEAYRTMIAGARKQARQISRNGGGLQRDHHAALYRHGRPLHPRGPGCPVHDGGRDPANRVPPETPGGCRIRTGGGR